MVDNSHQMNSNTYAKNQGLRGKKGRKGLQNGVAEWGCRKEGKNGVAERKNRTIMEAARAMIHDQDIPMHLWAEATRTTVYV